MTPEETYEKRLSRLESIVLMKSRKRTKKTKPKQEDIKEFSKFLKVKTRK